MRACCAHKIYNGYDSLRARKKYYDFAFVRISTILISVGYGYWMEFDYLNNVKKQQSVFKTIIPGGSSEQTYQNLSLPGYYKCK